MSAVENLIVERIKNIDEVLATEDIFDDVKKGSHASFLKETFGTDDKRKIINA